jgi:hypothetical protein
MVCTQKMSDSEWKSSPVLAKARPIATQPSGTRLGSENRTFDNPLSARAFESLSDNLFTTAFNRTTADQIALGTKPVVAHAMAVIGEVGHRLLGFVMFAG